MQRHVDKFMIVLTAAMLKAGSSWFYNMVNDLVVAAGHDDGRSIRKRFRLQRMLSESDCTSRTLRFHRLALISIPHWFGKTFTMKTHGRPTFSVKRMIDGGAIKAIYLYRDPRDVTISLFEHGQWIRNNKIQSRTRFDSLTTFEDAMDVALYHLQISRLWIRSKRALLLRYEDLLQDPFATLKKVSSHIAIPVEDQRLRKIIDHYDARNRGKWEHDLHFNVGKSGRWRDELNAAQQLKALELFADYLPELGYMDN